MEILRFNCSLPWPPPYLTIRDTFLTSYGINLLRKVRDLLESLETKFIWSGRDGVILIRESENAKIELYQKKLVIRTLGLTDLEVAHTAENIKAEVIKLIPEYGLTTRASRMKQREMLKMKQMKSKKRAAHTPSVCNLKKHLVAKFPFMASLFGPESKLSWIRVVERCWSKSGYRTSFGASE